MAIRYSGRLTVRVAWIDARDQYRACVSNGVEREVIFVGAPPARGHAVDCPAAYDAAAHAAISFAAEDLQRFADHTGEGWRIERKPSNAILVYRSQTELLRARMREG